jgi:hypothetical protein
MRSKADIWNGKADTARPQSLAASYLTSLGVRMVSSLAAEICQRTFNDTSRTPLS